MAAAVAQEGDDAAIRVDAAYEPVGGAGTKVYPPTYPLDGERVPYLVEKRLAPDGELVDVVLLDSRQSQANRCEEALQGAIDGGRVFVPFIEMVTQVAGRALKITSLTAPHRSRDAYFRDAEDLNGQAFDKTEPGQALAGAGPFDGAALYRYSPADLVYGVWDSHRGLRQAAKHPRVYTSELVGERVEVGARAAGRFDLIVSGGRKVLGEELEWEPGDGSKGHRLSEYGHGSIPPGRSVGGVTVGSITRVATVGFAGLARVELSGAPEEARRAARVVLAALALAGDRLAFDHPAIFLRSGCELVTLTETVSWVARGGGNEPLTLSAAEALELFAVAVDRAGKAGLSWPTEPIRLRPMPKLQQMIEESFVTAPEEGE
jgi:CRISPR-associated protein Csb1